MKRLYIVKAGDGHSSWYSTKTKIEDSYPTKITLFFSKIGNCWSPEFAGKKGGSIEDDGNGIDLSVEDKSVRLDYSQIEMVRCLLVEYDRVQTPLNQTSLVCTKLAK